MFFPPTFNITCDIFRNATPLTNPPDIIIVCQLRLIKDAFFGVDGVGQGMLLLCLPKRTDIRPFGSTSFHDIVQAPSTSGQWWTVIAVGDVGRGFVNEYRVALLKPSYELWTIPIN